MVLDAFDRPVVSYSDETNLDLKVLHCGTPNCTSANTIVSPDTGGNVGRYTAVVLDSLGNPVISYQDYSGYVLRVLHCVDPSCSSVKQMPAAMNITSNFQGSLPKTCIDIMDSGQVFLFSVCDNDFQGAASNHAACDDGSDTICNDEDPTEGSVTITVDPAVYHVEVGKTPLNITADTTKAICSSGPTCSLTFTSTSEARPWNPWDVAGPDGSWPPDGVVDLPNDILGVILHFCPIVSDPCAKP